MTRFYCEYGCKTPKNNPCYFMSEENRRNHYHNCHYQEYMDVLEQRSIEKFIASKAFPLASLGNILYILIILFM